MTEKQEIISGLKQAVERGYSLEQAKISFINAGYNSQDVEDSSKSISTGFVSQMQGMPNILNSSSQNFRTLNLPGPGQQPIQIQPKTSQIILPPKQKKPIMVTLLIVILSLVLILLLGILVATLFFRPSLIDFLAKLGYNI